MSWVGVDLLAMFHSSDWAERIIHFDATENRDELGMLRMGKSEDARKIGNGVSLRRK